MNLSKLFELQKQLDLRIEQQHPSKEGEDRLAKKILALQVELGELANCWRGFKYWSRNQKPRRAVYEICEYCEGRKRLGFRRELCWHCGGKGLQIVKRPLLEEYVDCLQFILSIGLELYEEDIEMIVADLQIFRRENIIQQFQGIFYYISRLRSGGYVYLFEHFLGLGEMLGFTWKQIEQAYLKRYKKV